MTTMLSLILAFMLSIGGSPAASVNPAGCPGDTGIQARIDNNPTTNRFFEDYREKTASRPISKKILEIPLIKQPKTQMRLRFSLYLKEELRLMGYMDSMNLYQAFGMNPVNFTDPFGTVIKAEYGKHDILSTQEVKTGKWYLDYTVVGAFNELRNAAALVVNLGSNLLGTADDVVFDVFDYGLSKTNIIERGELKNDPHMRTFFAGISLNKAKEISSGTRFVMDKLDDLTLSLYKLVKSKGGKVLDVRKNVMVFTDAEVSTDEMAKIYVGSSKSGGPVKSFVRVDLPDLPKKFAREFEGTVRIRTFKKGDKVYRSPWVPDELASNPGPWFGTRKTATQWGTDSMYQIKKWKNPNTNLRTYEFINDVTVYYGKVKGGTGYQLLFPIDVKSGDVLKFISEVGLK